MSFTSDCFYGSYPRLSKTTSLDVSLLSIVPTGFQRPDAIFVIIIIIIIKIHVFVQRHMAVASEALAVGGVAAKR